MQHHFNGPQLENEESNLGAADTNTSPKCTETAHDQTGGDLQHGTEPKTTRSQCYTA